MHLIEILGLIGCSFIRAFVISVKYAYLSHKKLEFYRKKALSEAEKNSELLIEWAKQTEDIIEKEVNETISRNHIETSMFKMSFLKPLTPELLLKVSKYKVFRTDLEKTFDFFCDKNQYPGDIVAKILLKSNKNNGFLSKFIFPICITLSLIRAIIPVIYRYYEHNTMVGSTPFETFIIICVFLANTYFFMVNLLFIINNIIEYERLVRFLALLSNLLSPERTNEFYKVKKEFPTINVFCIISLNAWFSLHKVFRDYGKRFFNRIDMHLGIFLGYYIIVTVVLILEIFKIINYQDPLMLILFGYELFIMFIGLFTMILEGVNINEHFKIHRSLINELRDVVSNFLINKDFYFNKKGDFQPIDEIYSFGRQILMQTFDTISHKEGEENSVREGYLRNLLEVNKYVCDQLTFYESKYPFKVLGVTADMPLFQRLLAGLGTAITFAAQRLMP